MFTRDATQKTLYSNSVEFEEGVEIDIPCIVRTLRFLYPKSVGVIITFL